MERLVIPFKPRRKHWLTAHRRYREQSLDRLETCVKQIKEGEKIKDDLKYETPADKPILIMTRTFNAPRKLVWKALSEPEHLVRWWGPHGHKNRVIEFDWRVGGKWKIETKTAEGQVVVFFGEYREIVAPEKVTQTFSFDGLPEGAHSVDTVILEDRGNKTIYRATSILPDIASRDAMMASGMDVGVRE
ncbi:MAG: SRPBCC domain-containing protein, partial [Cucumibacter sp.]